MKITFRFFKYAIFSGIFFLNHLHADFYQDFAKANQACEAYLTGRTDDWQTPANLFIQGFNDLNGKLQSIWRSLVGDGESTFPWNGVPSNQDAIIRRGYNKCDCPIVLHAWLTNHVERYTLETKYSSSSYSLLFTTYIPIDSNLTTSKVSQLKGQYKRKLLKNVFYKKTLRDCALFLNDKFCKPISNLLAAVLKKKDVLTLSNIKLMLDTYSIYDRVDTGSPINSQFHYQPTKEAIHKFLADYYFNFLNHDPETKAWLTQLVENFKRPYGDNAGIGQYSIDLTLFLRNLISNITIEGPIKDLKIMTFLNIVVKDWSEREKAILASKERSADIQAFGAAMNALRSALY